MKLKRIRWVKCADGYKARVGDFRLRVQSWQGAWRWLMYYRAHRTTSTGYWCRPPAAKRACRRWLENLTSACAEIEGEEAEA